MDTSRFTQSLEQLSSGYLAAYARGAERYAALLSGASGHDPNQLSTEQLQQRYAEFIRSEGPRVVQQLAEASLNYYTLVLNTGVETANRFFERMAQSDAAPEAPGGQPKARSALVFRGTTGESSSNAFVVANNKGEPIEVRFDAGEMVSDDGNSRIRPNVRFDPATCRVAPHSEQIVRASLLLSDDFPPGVDHRGQIQVVGFPDMAMDVVVQTQAASLPEPPLRGAQPATKPSPKGSISKSTAKRTSSKPGAKSPARRPKTSG